MIYELIGCSNFINEMKGSISHPINLYELFVMKSTNVNQWTFMTYPNKTLGHN